MNNAIKRSLCEFLFLEVKNSHDFIPATEKKTVLPNQNITKGQVDGNSPLYSIYHTD
ncbi:hypothetical protein NTGHW29_130008 [Candidatus Nitrotoga sp. HW29]|nr:hypothetical protein NTGHW29_130008 [Candidatus Nitrotoga sp. HW29]